jgi:hypothetical protein
MSLASYRAAPPRAVYFNHEYQCFNTKNLMSDRVPV